MLQEIQTISLQDVYSAQDAVDLYRMTGICAFTDEVTSAEINHELPAIYEAIAISALIGFLANNSGNNASYNNFLLANYISVSEQMRTDETTGYMNKRGLYYWAKNEYDPEHNTYGIFAVDLSQFKKVNDTLGHAAGDDALKLACDAIASQTRVRTSEVPVKDQDRRSRKTEDILSVARVGGDEIVFVMNFNGLDAEIVSIIIARVEDNLRSKNMVMKSDDGRKEQSFGFRVGSVVTGPLNQTPFLDAIRLADNRQYQSRTDQDR